jgi:hypothetical protein
MQAAWRRAAAETVPPQVAILLVASPEALESRLFRGRAEDGAAGFSRREASSSRRPVAAGTVACVGDDAAVARLVRHQERLVAAVRDEGPRATVTINADDIPAAVHEAVAAVEALA